MAPWITDTGWHCDWYKHDKARIKIKILFHSLSRICVRIFISVPALADILSKILHSTLIACISCRAIQTHVPKSHYNILLLWILVCCLHKKQLPNCKCNWILLNAIKCSKANITIILYDRVFPEGSQSSKKEQKKTMTDCIFSYWACIRKCLYISFSNVSWPPNQVTDWALELPPTTMPAKYQIFTMQLVTIFSRFIRLYSSSFFIFLVCYFLHFWPTNKRVRIHTDPTIKYVLIIWKESILILFGYMLWPQKHTNTFSL